MKRPKKASVEGTPLWRLTSESYIALHHGYTAWLKTMGYAEKSRDLYSRNVSEFMWWLEEKEWLVIKDIGRSEIETYKEYISSRTRHTKQGGLSSSSINIKLQCVKSLGQYLRYSYGIPLDQYIPKEETTHKKYVVLSEEEIDKLYSCTYRHRLKIQGLRDRILLHLYYGCGLRRREAVDLDVMDVDIGKEVVRVVGKNNKERYVPLHEEMISDFVEYLEVGRGWYMTWNSNRTKRVKEERDKSAFLLSHKGSRLSYNGVGGRIRYLRKHSKVNKRFSCHSLRHSIATHLLQNGMDIEDIAKFLGHSSIESTQIYTHLANEEI